MVLFVLEAPLIAEGDEGIVASRAGELRPAQGIAHNAECDVGACLIHDFEIQRYAQALLIRL